MASTSDQIARVAELIAATDLSRSVGGRFRRPLFRTVALGDKYPTIDLLVDVLDPGDVSLGFFFVQVKGTTATRTSSRLPVPVSRDRFNRLVRVPAPTYLVGVDVATEASFLVTAYRRRRSDVSSITRAYCLRDDTVKIELYREVLAFWKANRPVLQRTRFKDV